MEEKRRKVHTIWILVLEFSVCWEERKNFCIFFFCFDIIGEHWLWRKQTYRLTYRWMDRYI